MTWRPSTRAAVFRWRNRVTFPVRRATTQIAQRWGRLSAPTPVPIIDGLLAATAQIHGHVLVTRNTKDFVGSGTVLLDPFVPSGASGS